MYLLPIVLFAAVCLAVAYIVYGKLLARLLHLDPNAVTPAHELRDDIDYSPTEPKFLMSQHFSAIAAAGPIVGPILAGIMFGWLPALIWILFGSIFIGGVHDITALVASVRHKARSIAEVVRVHMSRRSYVLFLLFIWIALVYIIVAFTDIVAASFVNDLKLDDNQTFKGSGVASSSLMYLALPIVMGLLLRFTRLSIGWATVIFLPLVALSIVLGQSIPFDLGALFNLTPVQAHKAWDVILLAYCFVASLVPLWFLLQPRGHLGGYFLYFALGGGALGLILGGAQTQYPAFTGWTAANGSMLFPMLFITIACGACSGFHSIIASGTTSKQLRTETDAKVIGYGAMLLEGMVAVVSLCCVMMLTKEQAATIKEPSFIYAKGLASFLGVMRIPESIALAFGMLAFTTFVYDTLDVCTRLGRYIIQELTGMTGNVGRWVATALTAGTPILFIMQTQSDPVTGKVIPAWRVFWNLFGASNQLLAALTLVGVTVWLWRTYRARWVFLVVGLPTVFMYVMSTWALLLFVRNGFFTPEWGSKGMPSDPVPWAALVLVALALLVLVEALRSFRGTPAAPLAPPPQPAPALGA